MFALEQDCLKASVNRWQVFQFWADSAIGKRISFTKNVDGKPNALALGEIARHHLK